MIAPVPEAPARPNPVKLFDMIEGYGALRNLLGAGDPDVNRIDGRWWMFFGAFHSGFKNNLFSASLPPGAPLDSDAWSITASADDPRHAVPLVEQPPRGSWDHDGLHNPSYVAGEVPDACGRRRRCERIYYTGRNGTAFVENDRPLAIGVMERRPEGWVRRPEPVLRGTADRPSALEPKVRFFEGKWRLWYVAARRVAGRTTAPDYQLRYVESEDGITGWSEPTVLFQAGEGYYEAAVTAAAGGYEMVVCRSGNLGRRRDFPDQGIWWLRGGRPSGDRRDWTPRPVRILDADREAAADWYAGGATDVSVQHEDDRTHVFFTGVHRDTGWFWPFLRRLAAFRRPPFPAPFYLAIGRLDCRRSPAPGGCAGTTPDV